MKGKPLEDGAWAENSAGNAKAARETARMLAVEMADSSDRSVQAVATPM
jgi:hypothetical protein